MPKYIPPEILHQISASLHRNDLLSMTTVNRCFQVEAERLLYESIGHELSIDATISCFDILIAVKSKAILVKSLVIDHPNAGPILIARLCDCMQVLSSLTHLQLLLPYKRYAPPINAALQHCTFSLTSLLISNIFDVTSLVHNQKTLKSIAVVSLNPHPSADDISGYQQWIQDSPENCLTVCHLCRLPKTHFLISVFPMILRRWNAGPIKELLLRSFMEEPIFLALYIETLSNNVLIRQIVSSLSHYSIDIAILALCVNDPDIERDPETLSSILSPLSLWGFSVLFSNKTSKGSYVDRRTDLAKIWSSRCPTLDRVEFPDGTTYSKINGSWPQ